MTGRYAESWLKFEEELGFRPILNGSAEEMRAQHGSLMGALAPQYPPNPGSIQTTDGTHGSFSYRVYHPVSYLQESLPVGVYYHPGGLVIGPSIADDSFCATLAAQKNIVIVAIKYRLSPEYLAPSHLQDALNGFEWAHNNAASFGGDARKLFVIGVSAGAGLAFSLTRKIVLCQSMLDPATVNGVVVFCPVLLHPDNIPDIYKSIHTSSTDNGENVPLVDGISMRLFFSLAGLDAEDMDYFPALDADIYKRFPPTYISTSEMDSLRDDGRVLVETLKNAGVSVKTDYYPGLPHCFWIVPSLPETETFIANAYEGIQWVIDQM